MVEPLKGLGEWTRLGWSQFVPMAHVTQSQALKQAVFCPIKAAIRTKYVLNQKKVVQCIYNSTEYIFGHEIQTVFSKIE